MVKITVDERYPDYSPCDFEPEPGDNAGWDYHDGEVGMSADELADWKRAIAEYDRWQEIVRARLAR